MMFGSVCRGSSAARLVDPAKSKKIIFGRGSNTCSYNHWMSTWRSKASHSSYSTCNIYALVFLPFRALIMGSTRFFYFFPARRLDYTLEFYGPDVQPDVRRHDSQPAA